MSDNGAGNTPFEDADGCEIDVSVRQRWAWMIFGVEW